MKVNTLLTALGLTIALSHIAPSVSLLPSARLTISRSALAATTSSNSWRSILGTVVAPPRWTVQPCNGMAHFLCATANQKLLGSVEFQTYPVEQHPVLRKMVSRAGVAPGSTRDSPTTRQAQIQTALRAWVADHYATISRDRRSVYRNGEVFTTRKPQIVNVGQLQGMQYGFSGRDRRGKTFEHHIGYVASDGNQLYIITTSYDGAALPGGFKSLQDLQQFEPYLTRIVTRLRLGNSYQFD